MMKNILLILILALIPVAGKAVAAHLPEPRTMQLIVDTDREIAGLLDAYLEAVPECPVYPDTPIRLWVLDLAWLRADAAISEIKLINEGAVFSDSTVDVWEAYLFSSTEYLRVFSEIQRIYHQTNVPDGAVCIELESMLLNIDSLWHIHETRLFELFAEEEVR